MEILFMGNVFEIGKNWLFAKLTSGESSAVKDLLPAEIKEVVYQMRLGISSGLFCTTFVK